MSKIRGASVCIMIGTLRAGGAERVAVWLAGELDKLGCSVTIVTHSPPEDDFYSVRKSIQRRSINSTKGGRSPLAKIYRNIVRVLVLRSCVREIGASHVIAFMPQESVLSILASFGLKVRVVVSERNAPWHRSPGQMWEVLRRMVYRFSSAQVVQTKQIGQWLSNEVAASAVAVIPNAVQWPLPESTPAVDPHSILRPNRRVLLAVGSKPYQKGLDIVVEAFAIVSADFPDWDLVIPPFRAETKERHLTGNDILQWAEAAGIRDRIVLPGFVGNMQAWYEAADIYVLSSRFEGFPNSLIEAMAAGCPCVAFACETGPDEIIQDEVDGLLVRELTAEALAKALARAMGEPALRDRLAAAAPGVKSRYAPGVILNEWCRVLGLKPAEPVE